MYFDTVRIRSIVLIAVLGLLTAIDAIAIDMYLPAMPSIQMHFGTTAGRVQASLTIFLIGLAIGQACVGPMADRYGRRWPLMLGMALFVAGTLLILTAPFIEVLLIGRFLQAVGAAAGLVVPRAIVADRYSSDSAAQIYTILMHIMSVAPIFAPLAGSALLTHWDWRSVFWVLLVFGLICLVCVFFFVPETLVPEGRSTGVMSKTIRDYCSLLRCRKYMNFTMASAFVTAGLFSYIGSAPFVFIESFHVSPEEFSWFLALNGLGMLLTGMINFFLLRKYSALTVLHRTLHVHFALTAILLAICLTSEKFLLIVVPLCGAIWSLGLVWGNVIALAMEHGEGRHGAASALFGVLQYAVGGLAGVLLGLLSSHEPWIMAMFLTVCAAAACLAVHGARRKSRERSSDCPQAD
ncbi:multidrug effflux MFS transporter [Pseudomonas saponiphila]|uniref:multidrug effflux MFS transporter n=1 Tax=Pseudomonas saponiphila TaxID=556534 RepID=UPI00223FC347|nr:multidrug effflux MFS transporter [Pseudomonas saponiphila]